MTETLTGPGNEPENKVWAGKAGPKVSPGGRLLKKGIMNPKKKKRKKKRSLL